MNIALLILLIIVGLCILALACVVLIPFYVRVEGGYRGTWYGSAAVRWWWGLMALHLHLSEKTGAFALLEKEIVAFTLAAGHEARPRTTKTKRKGKRPGIGSLTFIPDVLRTARAILRSLRLRGRIDGVFGTGDPADTAVLYGGYRAMRALVPVPIFLAPSLEKPAAVLHGVLSARVLVIRCIVPVLGLLFSARGRRLLRSFV